MEDEIMQATNSSHNAMGIKNYVIARFLYAVIDDVLLDLSDMKVSLDIYFTDDLFETLSRLYKTDHIDSSDTIQLLLGIIERRADDYNLPMDELLRRLCSRGADLNVQKHHHDRFQEPSEVVIDDDQNSNVSVIQNKRKKKLSDTYLAKFRGSFNLKWNHSHHPTDIPAYKKCTIIPARIPYYKKPKDGVAFPAEIPNLVIHQPDYVSILPLLISARHYQVDIQEYDIISERNSFRKIVMNNENYVISVQKIGSTVFLRRHDEHPDAMNSFGHRFERLCTPGYITKASYYQLIDGNIGKLRTLISAETDAVITNEHAIELKCSTYSNMNWNYLDQPWLQTFLSKCMILV
ncbi:unnamed protein product [Adineta steineri]|uniref:Uncharacterized protein n=1 Tax=Adineta steineri TaxID=433720 RepID=A0A819W5Z1_9BILA|nr:unnamed protein product [Adineta steineri]